MKETIEKLPFDKLDKSFHEPARLAILSILINEPKGLSYNELKDRLELTYGNLERHMRVLADAELVAIEKMADGGRPKSFARISETGKTGFLDYLDHLESILHTAQQSGIRSKSADADKGFDGLAYANS
jgi:DNA-binding transcriptional ArsR family regulator